MQRAVCKLIMGTVLSGWSSAKGPKHPDVARNRFSYSLVLVVWQIEFRRCLPNNPGNLLIMHVTDVREEVMLNLMVKPSGQPGY